MVWPWHDTTGVLHGIPGILLGFRAGGCEAILILRGTNLGSVMKMSPAIMIGPWELPARV